MNDRGERGREAAHRTLAMRPDVFTAAAGEAEPRQRRAVRFVGENLQQPSPVLDKALSSLLDELFADTPKRFNLGLFISGSSSSAAVDAPQAAGGSAPARNPALYDGGGGGPTSSTVNPPPASDPGLVAFALLDPESPNNPPVAADLGPYSLPHDTTVADDISVNCYDPDGDPISFALVGGPAHAAAFSFSGGEFSYTPEPGYVGGDGFSYQVSDGSLNSDVASVSLDVFNNPPVAADLGPYSLPHDTTVADDISVNSYDPDGDEITFALVNGPAHAAAFSFNGGAFSYTPAVHFVGGDSFSYKVSDGLAESSVATVAFDVFNNPPVAAADGVFDVIHTRYLMGQDVLGNDYDPDGDQLTAILVGGPSHAYSFYLNANGSFNYASVAGSGPVPIDYVGPDSFTYKVSDGITESDSATVSINVYNTSPIANADEYTILHDTILSDSVVVNDTDAENDSLDVKLQGLPPQHALSFNFTSGMGGGSFTYIPEVGFVGTVGFSYSIDDHAGGDSSAALIHVYNNDPVSAADSFTTLHDTPLSGNVLTNDSDPDEEDLDAVLVSGPAHAATFNFDASTGGFYYDPAEHWAGTDTFSYQATDGAGHSGTATVTIDVTNYVPSAGDDYFSLIVNTTLNVPAKGVLENDTDGDNDPLEAVVAAGPAHGVLTFNTNGSFTYVPNLDYTGQDQFTYRATDQVEDSPAATVILDVLRVRVDLDVDSDNSGSIDGTDEEDLIEMSAPAEIIAYNDDDDNLDDTSDREESPLMDDEEDPVADDDLVEAYLSLDNPYGDDLDGFWLVLSVNAPAVRVWNNADKEILLASNDGMTATTTSWLANDPERPSVVYVEGYEPGTAQLALLLQNPSLQPVHEDKALLTTLKVNLDIANGGSPPSPVPDNLEEKRGAYTVANLNDTDGDGRIDLIDDYVRAGSQLIVSGGVAGSTTVTVADTSRFHVGDDVLIDLGGAEFDRPMITEVDAGSHQLRFSPALTSDYPLGIVHHMERDEVDLMPLLIQQPSTLINGDLNLTLRVTGGSVRLWDHPWKETEIPLNASNEATISLLTVPPGGRVIYVEATAVSTALHDIKIELEYHGVKDAVWATGVWVEETAVAHDFKNAGTNQGELFADPVWGDTAGPVRTAIDEVGGVGLRPIPSPSIVRQVANGILVQFTISPARDPAVDGTWEGDGVRFDATRQRETYVWARHTATGSVWIQASAEQFPRQVELPNDDEIDGLDESGSVTVDNHYYYMDAPGLASATPPIPSVTDLMMLHNFKDFVRVRFDNIKPKGDVIIGSRASPYFLWHSSTTLDVMTLPNGNRQWRRTTGDAAEVEGINDAGEGHVVFGNPNN